MKLKSVKIKNYKSYCEEDNNLVLEDISTIIGKNESGKSNLIEALLSINYDSIPKSLFECNNRKSVNEVELLVTFESNEIEETTLVFKKNIIEIMGGISNIILNDVEFQNILKEVIEQSTQIQANNITINNWHQSIIKKLSNCNTELFIYDINQVNKVIEHFDFLNQGEYIKKMIWCINYLKNIYNNFPKIIKITNNELETHYSREIIQNDKEPKNMLLQLLNAINYSIEDIKNYWKLQNQAQQADFEEILKEDMQILIDEFNQFYTQDKIQLIPTIESSGLYLNVKTNGMRIGITERSNGLKWYLNLFIQTKSQMKNSKIKNCVLVMDEPGVYLHVDAQKELKKLFEHLVENDNQVIYTTHSPFMIYSDKLNRTKLIIKDEQGNTHISNKYYDTPHNCKSKTETISPMLNAIGMSMNYNLLVGNEKINIITEGISDYNYIMTYLYQKKICDKYHIIPSSGVSNIKHLSSILIGWNCKFKIILDYDKAGKEEYKKLTQELLINSKDIIFTNLLDSLNLTHNHQIEDLFSYNDKTKIGIFNEDYYKEKAAYSLSILEKVRNKVELLTDETILNFDKLFEKIESNHN